MLTNPTSGAIWMEKIDSTSSALARMQENLPDRSIIVADYQSEGRGQGDHLWHSAMGENLTFSILFKYEGRTVFPASRQQLLTMACSLGVTDYLSATGIEAKIKLPNDIYVGGRKICGMLIENSIAGKNMTRSIVGIGLNVNQKEFPSDIPSPVSMKDVTGIHYDRNKCLNELVGHLFHRFDAIWTEPETLVEEYEEKSLHAHDDIPGDI